MPGCTDLPGTYLKIYLLFMTVSAVVIANPLCFAGEAEDRATASAAPVLDSWATPGGFYENLSRPLMSGDTPLYTLDGSSSGPSRINCPSTRTALELVIGRGPTGDLNFLSAACDLDADGTLNHVLSINSTPVSGVCANGFISCTPGTWYQWEVTGSRLGFQPVGTPRNLVVVSALTATARLHRS